MIIARPIENRTVEQSSRVPVQGSPGWRSTITGRKTSSTNSHRATVDRSASNQRAWLFLSIGSKRANLSPREARSCRKKGRLSRAIVFKRVSGAWHASQLERRGRQAKLRVTKTPDRATKK